MTDINQCISPKFKPLGDIELTQDEQVEQLENSRNWKNLDRIELTLEELNLLIDNLSSMSYSGPDLLKNPALPEFSLVICVSRLPLALRNVVSFRKTVIRQKEFIQSKEGLNISSIPILDAFFYPDHQGKVPDATFSIGCSVLELDGNVSEINYSSVLVKPYPNYEMMTDEEMTLDMHERAWKSKLLYLAIQCALINRPTVFSISTDNVVVKIPRKHSGKSRRKIKAIKVLRINPKHLSSESQEPKKIGCPCWGVMGHYRTTKSNKQVWIKPHLKGKHRDNPNTYQAKQYVIQAGDMQ